MKLIDKAAVVAEIQRRKELVSDPILSGNDLMIGERNAFFNLLSFLDTLEVKEDLFMNTNKIDLIKAEVEKLKSQLLRGACSSQIAMETRCKEEAYNEVLAIIDTMQEEPVSE